MEEKSLPNVASLKKKAVSTTAISQNSIELRKPSSTTHYYKENKQSHKYLRVSKKEFLSESESISGSSASFGCVHGPNGRQYSPEGLLKRNLTKYLDPVKPDPNWSKDCPVDYDWNLSSMLVFLILDPVGHELERLNDHLRDYTQTTSNGFNIRELDNVCIILNYLAANCINPILKEYFMVLLKCAHKPIHLQVSSDIIKYFEVLQNYYCSLGFILLTTHEDDIFDLVHQALLWQLSAAVVFPDEDAVARRYVLKAAGPVLVQSVSRMIAACSSHRYRAFVELALTLACESTEYCIDMMEENIIENIFYRYNPYFPQRKLPSHEIGPRHTEDINVKLGDSTIHSSTVLSLLLVLLKNTKDYLKDNPNAELPVPDDYSVRCFSWAFRYECRARGHNHERNTITAVTIIFLSCYGSRCDALARFLMADVLSLSVFTEIPIKPGWLKYVSFNTSQSDVCFKRLLIYLSVDFIIFFRKNNFEKKSANKILFGVLLVSLGWICGIFGICLLFNIKMIESQYWLLGLMYLLDPALAPLRAHWSPSHFMELRKIALQAIICTFSIIPSRLFQEYALVRRLMWYVEWYSHTPYDLTLLYWVLRVLLSVTGERKSKERYAAVKDMFHSHGIIIITHLCHTLLDQKVPPVEKSQAIIALSLRLLATGIEANTDLSCEVYKHIKWPECINGLACKILSMALPCIQYSHIISDRLLVALLNFIWEAIIWNDKRRERFIASDGIYKLLDLITMTNESVQCIALAVLCDMAKTGDAVAQLVSWRTKLQAASVSPQMVKHSSTIASLLANIFRDECHVRGIKLDENNIIQDVDNPLMSNEVRRIVNRAYPIELISRRTPVCLAVSDLAGSRMPKVFALMHLISEDLKYKVSVADEAYKLYKNIELSREDEVVLVLAFHYLTAKINEAWSESTCLKDELLPEDQNTLDEFLQLGKGWAKEIKQRQEEVLERHRKKDKDDEASLYSFLGRVRLHIALDALCEVCCVARTANRSNLTHIMLLDAVHSHYRRSSVAKKMQVPILKTYKPRLDYQNQIGQNIKMRHKKEVPKKK